MRKSDKFICDNCKNVFYSLTELAQTKNRDYQEICMYCYNEDLGN